MKRRAFRQLGLHASLLAVCLYVNQPLLAQLDAGQNLRQVDADGVACLASTPDSFRPLQEVWSNGFELEFVVGGSAMVFRQATGSGQWDVLIVDEAQKWVGQGIFVEDSRFALAGDMDARYLDELGFEYYKRHLVVGTLVGSTGVSMPMYGVLTELGGSFVLENGDPAVAFSPLFVDENLDTVRQRGEEYAYLFNSNTHRAGNGLGLPEKELSSPLPMVSEKSDPACHALCDSEFEADLDSCTTVALACIGVAATAAALCVLACASTTVGFPIWAAACLTAQAAAEALCIANQEACNRAARKDNLACHKSCIEF